MIKITDLKYGKYQNEKDYTPEEMEIIKADIEANGVLEPIEYDENNDILDGHMRTMLILKLQQEGKNPDYKLKQITGLTEEEKLARVRSKNEMRRHIDKEEMERRYLKRRRDAVREYVRFTKNGIKTSYTKTALKYVIPPKTFERDLLEDMEYKEWKAQNTVNDGKTGNTDGTRLTGDKTQHQQHQQNKVTNYYTKKKGGYVVTLENRSVNVRKNLGTYLEEEKANEVVAFVESMDFIDTKEKAEKLKQKVDSKFWKYTKGYQRDVEKERKKKEKDEAKAKNKTQDAPPPPKEEPKRQEEPKQEPKQEETKQEKQEAKQDEPRQQEEEQQEEGYWTKKVKEKIRESDKRFHEIAQEIETLSQLMEFVVGSEVFYEMLKIGHREIAKKYHADKNNGVESEKMSEANEIWNAFKKFMKRN